MPAIANLYALALAISVGPTPADKIQSTPENIKPTAASDIAPPEAAAQPSSPSPPSPPRLSLPPSQQIDQQQADEDMPSDIETVDATTDYNDRLTVPVTIGGEGPFQFMIDTGAQATVVTHRLSDRLGLKQSGTAKVIGMASERRVNLVHLDGLKFAARTINNIDAPLLRASHIGADGILGLDSLQDLRVMIDFREERIAVGDAKVLGGNRGYEIIVRARHRLGRLIIAKAKVNNVTTSVIIDTGAQNSIGNLALRKRLRGRQGAAISSMDVNGAILTGTVEIARKLTIGDVNLTNLPIAFASAPAFRALDLDKRPALILGMRDLRLFDRVAIDFADRKVLFDLPKDSGYLEAVYFPSRLK